ncbi:MAG TPA: DegT/DnrJ/EryC1/StrS aminotransferase family protein [Acidimicrobiales bacterium]|nr:DegT/DnrJ/EryC1/StrS aminotransferase family protein [Acidimicrobiales bacterium]
MVAWTSVSPTLQSDEPEPVFPRWDATTRNVIPFIDLAAQRSRLGGRIETAIARVLEHGEYILGPEVFAFEDRLSRFCGAHHAVSCANGTDALMLAMLAVGIERGDAVFTPSLTFAATAEAIVLAGGTPVFVDVRRDTFNLDVDSLRGALAVAAGAGLRPKGVVAVDLYGQPAEYEALANVAQENGLWVVADAAQSFGASLNGRRSGCLATVTATSFYPAKPLGGYGDGGAVLTDDDEVAEKVTSLRTHGQSEDRFDHVRIGMNSRLDTIQAAILLEKLEILEDELGLRQEVARRYDDGLVGVVDLPVVVAGAISAWAQYTLKVSRRDRLAGDLRAAGVPTAIYYPRPLHEQPAFTGFPASPRGLSTSEELARSVLSLPMHPYLDAEVQDQIVVAVRQSMATA